jgi:hypothetical protein
MQIEYELTQQDFVEGCRVHCWRRYKPRTKQVMRFIQSLVALALCTEAYLLYRIAANPAMTLLILVLGLYLLLGPLVIAPYLWRRLYRRTRGRDGMIVLTIADESIHIDCPGRSVGTIEWHAILGVLDRPTTTLLYFSPAQPLILPRRVLVDAAHEELLSICRRKDVPFTYPKPSKK